MSNQSFADLGVSNAVVDALGARGITEPFAVQRLVVSDILAGRDVLARSPTGSGKTLAFSIPMVDRIEADGPRPAALILAPTRELASQIVEETRAIAHARALRITAVYGGVGLSKQAKDAARSHILVATPGRLEDLLQRRAFDLRQVRLLVLDEADRMLDMGFKPAVDRIVAQCPRDRQTLFFSATLDGEAGRVAAAFTTNAVRHEHGPKESRAVAEVEHRFLEVERDDKIDALISRAARRSRAGARLRAHQARRRPPGQAPRHVAASTPSRCTATSPRVSARRRSRASRPVTSTRWSRPTSRPAASTSAGISHVINFDSAGRPRRLRPPHRAHRPRRADRDRHHVRRPRRAPRDERAGRRAGDRASPEPRAARQWLSDSAGAAVGRPVIERSCCQGSLVHRAFVQRAVVQRAGLKGALVRTVGARSQPAVGVALGVSPARLPTRHTRSRAARRPGRSPGRRR